MGLEVTCGPWGNLWVLGLPVGIGVTCGSWGNLWVLGNLWILV